MSAVHGAVLADLKLRTLSSSFSSKLLHAKAVKEYFHYSCAALRVVSDM